MTAQPTTIDLPRQNYDVSLEHQIALEESHRVREATGRFRVQGEMYYMDDIEIEEEGLKRLSAMMGIPSNFLPKVSQGLGQKLLEEFFAKLARQVLVVEGPGQVATSFMWADHQALPTAEIYRGIVDGTPGREMVVRKVRSGISSAQIFICEADAFNVIGDDDVHFGVHVAQSWDGSSPLRVHFSYFRPICSNGAVVTTQKYDLPRRIYTDRVAARTMIGMAVKDFLELGPSYGQKIRNMARHEVDDPGELVISSIRQLGLSPSFAPDIADAFEEEPEPTIWGVTNALTRAANTYGDQHKALQLWEAGGAITERQEIICKTCGRSH